MRVAKDGKPFDIDHLSADVCEGEVEVIQYLRPEGKRRRMLADVGVEAAKMAEDMVLSAEELNTLRVALYARFIMEPEEKEINEIAENGPGADSPAMCLARLIERKFNERSRDE